MKIKYYFVKDEKVDHMVYEIKQKSSASMDLLLLFSVYFFIYQT